MGRLRIIFGLLLLAPAAIARAEAPSAQGVEFFEKHVRPVLVEHCYKCHSASAEKLKGGLYLDTKEGVRKGGKAGAAIVPGEPEKSLLIKAVRREDDELAMPPKTPLAKEQVAALEAWVKMGAPDPREAAAKPAGELTVLSMADAKGFWSFKPVTEQAIPAVGNSWVKSPIDAFVLAKLKEKGLEPAPAADKRTLIRRAYIDLIGLPPSFEEVEAFVADTSAGAFEKVVDRLLASPQFGERWGRYWLDLARYADTKGYVFQEERRYPYAYTYRDWVVRALNDDMPYDQFVVYQVAADRVLAANPKAENRHLAAMGFLTLGRRFLNNQNDIIDDRIDVLTRGTMALTVACARCHDHKYDPIPAADYYSLHGVFASSVEPQGAELPLLETKEKSAATAEYEKELAKREAAVQKFRAERHAKIIGEAKIAKAIEQYLLTSLKVAEIEDRRIRDIAETAKLNGRVLRRWKEFLAQAGEKKDPFFAAWHALAGVAEAEFAAKSSEVVRGLSIDPKTAELPLVKALAAAPPKTLAELAAVYAKAIESEISNLKSEIAKRPEFPTNIPVEEIETAFNRADRNAFNEVRRKRDELLATHPGAPSRAMVMRDRPSPVQPVILKRGNPAMPGAAVPRQFLAVIDGQKREPFKDGSGRLELARKIASKENPLTARVWANRVWMHLFEKGLVRTPSDFGVRGERPTHPELLDFLAIRFVHEGWSTKKLIKSIVTSAAYQQSSVASEKALAADPENRLVSRQNRKRLDLEALRDSLLAASGQIDLSVGGRPVDLLTQPFTKRRTIYGFVDRQNLPSMFRAFDFASPDQHAPMRFNNTVPQQALFMLNSPFVIEKAKAVAAAIKETAPAEKVKGMYRAVLARDPSGDEVQAAVSFVEFESSQASAGLNPWEKLAQVLLQTNEFAFVD
jgi:cytochrome c553